MMTETKTIYTTYGSVRGCCGHRHRTPEAAQACIDRDQRGCASQGGYSDRSIATVGPNGYLYRDEACEDWIPGPGGRSNGAARLTD